VGEQHGLTGCFLATRLDDDSQYQLAAHRVTSPLLSPYEPWLDHAWLQTLPAAAAFHL
jgi:hypothetical protein